MSFAGLYVSDWYLCYASCRRETCTHVANTDLCPHELRSHLGTSRLWARWPHILDKCGSESDPEKQTNDWLSCAASSPGSMGVPETDTTLHACGSEANSITMPRLKRKLPSDVFRPQKGLRSHLRVSIFKNYFWGSMPPDPPSLILRIRVQVSVSRTNAILLPPSLRFHEYARSTPPYFPCT